MILSKGMWWILLKASLEIVYVPLNSNKRLSTWDHWLQKHNKLLLTKKTNINKQLKRDKFLIWLSDLGPFIQHVEDYWEFAK